LESAEGHIGLSAVVQAAVPRAIEMIERLAADLGEPLKAKPGLVSV
jgi:hypothetical protein